MILGKTPKDIEKFLFDFAKENRRTPSRKEFVDGFGIPGSKIMGLLGESAKNLESVWKIEEHARKLLAEKILEKDENLQKLLGPNSFLPLWAIECEIRAKKINDPEYDPSSA